MNSISKPGLFELTPEQAWTEGTNIRTALRVQPEQTRAAILKMIRDVVEFVEAKRTLNGVEDYLLTTEAIIQGHPTLKLEEIRLVMQGMKLGTYGHFYERLKTAQFLDCLKQHEASRAAILERINSAPPTRGLREGQEVKPHEPETLLDVMKRRNPLFKGLKHDQ